VTGSGSHEPAISRHRVRRGLLVGLVVLLAGSVFIGWPGAGSSPRRSPQPASSPAPTADGAVTAALEYLAALRWDVLVDETRRKRIIDRRAAPQAAPELDAQLAAPSEALRAAVTDGPVIARTAVLGYRVDRFERRQATVSIWGMALFGSGAYRPATQWSTSRVRLVWRRSRWLIDGLKSHGGPAPDFPLRTLVRAGRRFRELRHVP
jgi:hypothetical protein